MEEFEQIKILLERIANSLEIISHTLSQFKDLFQCEDFSNRENKPRQHLVTKKKEIQFINDYSEIEDFLNSKNIRIKHIKEEDEADEVLDRIAFFMGNRYSHIKNFYQNIKRTLNTGRTIRIDLKNCSQAQISSITQLCSDLYQIAFLEEYKYFKSPNYILYAKVNRIPQAINFFTGGWLERYVKTAVIEAIKSISTPVLVNYSYLKNPQIILPNGDDFELDILFKIEDEIFWFEAKTGDYQRYIEKYSKISKIMGLDYNHAFMILTDITEAGAQALKSLFKMNVVKIDKFFEIFKELILNLKPQEELNVENKK